MKAVVTGMIVTYPVGGVVWDYGQYLLGLEQLGFEVTYLEDTGAPTYDPLTRGYGADPAYGVRYLESALGLLSPTLKRYHFRAADGRCFGSSEPELAQIVAESDLFLNVSGGTLLRDAYLRARRKVLVDTDPGYNHFVNYPRWNRSPGWLGTHGYRAHDHFFTYAERLGAPGCQLPDLGLRWQPTRPPVALAEWRPEPPGARYTTVMTWNNFRSPIVHNDTVYGTKEREFALIQTLPQQLALRFEIALGGASAPTERWRELGWSIVDAHGISRTPQDYRGYVQQSRGELSVAKNVYVATGSGWFSCRSVCYLAAGRPVVVQDTGFSAQIPCGAGLHAFSDRKGALDALERVEADYPGQQQAARSIAREHFASERVLGDLLARVGLG